MKRSLTQVKIHVIWILLAAVGWSCTKDNQLQRQNPQTENAIAPARTYYESTSVPLTKTLGDRQIPIKPLPGEMTPQWDRATATVLENGIVFVDVPIDATITYTAVRHGFHHHDGETCEHDHSAVQTVQKLTVETLADGSQRSLVATIVPEMGCTAELRDFSSVTGLDGFAGFVSWHDLTGNLIRVAKYENGICTKNAEPTGDNEAEILEIVDHTILYPTTNQMLTKSGYCNLCKGTCEAPNDMSQHCNICGKYNSTEFGKESQCTCGRRCPWCNATIPSGQTSCPNGCGNYPVPPPFFCPICGIMNCSGHPNSPNPEPTPPYIVQEAMLKSTLYDLLTEEQYEEVKNGSYGADRFDQGPGYEHVHGMYIQSATDEPRLEGHTKMRDYFILNAQAFIYHGSYGHLGRALHPIIDTYISLQTRLNCYYYGAVLNIVDGANIVHYELNPSPCRSAIKYVYNALLKLPKLPTAAQTGAVFDGWLRTTGGGY